MDTHFTHDFLLLEVTVFTILRPYLYPWKFALACSRSVKLKCIGPLSPYVYESTHEMYTHKSRHELMGWPDICDHAWFFSVVNKIIVEQT